MRGGSPGEGQGPKRPGIGCGGFSALGQELPRVGEVAHTLELVKQEQEGDRMSGDRPDSDQERRWSRGRAPLSPHHPPGAETTGPGTEGMQPPPPGRKAMERSSLAPTLHSVGKKTKPNLMPSLGEPWVSQSFPEMAARSAWEDWSQAPAAGWVHPLCLHVSPPSPHFCSAGVCAAYSSLGSSLSSSAVQEPSLSGLACQAGTSPGCGPPGFMALISRQPDLDTASSGSPFPWKVPHKRLRSLFSAPGEKGLC